MNVYFDLKGVTAMKILAIDIGAVRTGVAVSDQTELLATPIGTFTEPDRDRLLSLVCGLAAEHKAGHIVVGHPKNMDGSEGASAQNAAAFAELLKEATGLPVTLWDERLTTVSAHHYLNETNVRGKKRKQMVDTVSAVIILQDYLDSKR